MAKVYFYYASMNAGKSTTLLQADYNYRERGQRTLLWTSAIDNRAGHGVIASRVGLKASARCFTPTTDIVAEILAIHSETPVDCVLVDEAQFLTEDQVNDLAFMCDTADIPVLAYGLRTDFRGQPFPGSARLLAIADSLIELKSVCACGRKATMNLRVDEQGKAVHDGNQTEIGGNERYVAMCRRHFADALNAADASVQSASVQIE